VHEATGGYVVTAFDAGNLQPVALRLRQEHPEARIIIAADNDAWTEGNPGLTKAKSAAKACSGQVVFPRFTHDETQPTDFNDLFCLEGIEQVKTQLEPTSIPEEEKTAQGGSQASQLIRLVSEFEFFHSTDQEAYARVPVGTHQEVWKLNSTRFRQILKRTFFNETGKALGNQARQDAMGVLEAKALYEGPCCPVHLRVAQHKQSVVIDLCDADWRVVEITKVGWTVLSQSPVQFRRVKGMLPLPIPTRDENLAELQHLVNVRDASDLKLIVGWLVGALHPTGPYPVLVIHGEQGSAKTTTMKMLRRLLDPHTLPFRSEPSEERDLMIGANNNHIMAFDNLSRMPPWLSDSLCRLATGGGFATRQLYTDDEEQIFGIEELTTRPDLLDRSILLYLPAFSDENPLILEEELEKKFVKAHPRLLGALFTAVSTALKGKHAVKLSHHPRMADFATWVEAAGPAFGWEPEEFLEGYMANRQAADTMALDSSLLPPALHMLLQESPQWTGTATNLLASLNQLVDEDTRRQRGWPKQPNWLSNALRRLTPVLRSTGISVKFQKGKDRLIVIERLEQARNFASIASLPSSKEAQSNALPLLGDAKDDKDAKITPLSPVPSLEEPLERIEI
jgi:hypothetical protein